MSNYYGSSNFYGNESGGFTNPQPPTQPPHQQQQQQQQQHFYQQQQPTTTGYNQTAGGAVYNMNHQQWQLQGDGQQTQPTQQQGVGGVPPQQQQLQQQPFSFWNPATVATVASLATAATSSGDAKATAAFQQQRDAMLIDLAGQTGSAVTKAIIPGFSSTMRVLRRYFAVDNPFILKKMQKILFPFFFRNWRRQVLDTTSSNPGPDHHNALMDTNYALPLFDENAPDLYLPSMSLISYVLLCALCYGTAGKFDPEVLPDVTTKCFVTQIIEVLLIRLGFYLVQVPVPLLDLLSYTGYKYLSLCVNLLVAMSVKSVLNYQGSGVYYLTFAWTASAASFVMLKTMANNIPTVTAAAGPKREIMVLAFSALQLATMWLVSQTKFL